LRRAALLPSYAAEYTPAALAASRQPPPRRQPLSPSRWRRYCHYAAADFNIFASADTRRQRRQLATPMLSLMHCFLSPLLLRRYFAIADGFRADVYYIFAAAMLPLFSISLFF